MSIRPKQHKKHNGVHHLQRLLTQSTPMMQKEYTALLSL